MRIEICDKKTIGREFSAAFPFLSLDFHAKPSRPGASHSKKYVRNPGTIVAECRTIHTEGTLTVVPEMTIFSLVRNFMDVYGLSVRVLRRSGKSWIPTTLTEDWTLHEQNKQGESLCKTQKNSLSS